MTRNVSRETPLSRFQRKCKRAQQPANRAAHYGPNGKHRGTQYHVALPISFVIQKIKTALTERAGA